MMRIAMLVSSLLVAATVFAQTAPTPAPTSTAQPTQQPDPSPTASAAPAAPALSAGVAPTASTPAAPRATVEQEYGLKMKELEDAVSELKEQIFRSKAKLTLLTEQVQGGSGAGAHIVITHKNQMGPNFLLVEVNYFLDGAPLWQEVDDAGAKLTPMKEHPIWDGNIVEGSHTLSVELRYKGNGTGVFQYLSGYNWKLKDSLTFTAEAGKLVQVDVVGYEAGNFTTEMNERPKIRFDKNVQADTVKAPGAK